MAEQEQDAAGGAGTFATRLTTLFSSMRREDGKPFSKSEVAEAAGITRSYLYTLLKGESEPSYAVATRLAEFFRVELEYFSDSERGRELARQHEILAHLGEQRVQQIAARASTLTPDALESVLQFIEFQASREERGDNSSG
ncbi:helix-turn-helix domain-containing protein [Saccharopolyspora cebuensis]|uniref:Helix-turn-helix domain-containing protein n=1 Tax=Saccharopolyspora cebuensis TaxID=418759 RepID=A0ABV4CRB9_9PSEU